MENAKSLKAKKQTQANAKAYLAYKDTEGVQRYQAIGLMSEWRKGSLQTKGLKLGIEYKPNAKDKALAASEAAWAASTPRKDGTARKAVDETWAAEGYALCRALTELGATKASLKAASSPRIKAAASWCRRAGVPEGTVVSLTETSSRQITYKPEQIAQPESQMAFFGTKDVAPTGESSSGVKAKIKRLMAAGFTVDECLEMVGL
jgi:hypothetical protein